MNGVDLAKLALATLYVDITKNNYDETRKLFLEVAKHNYPYAQYAMGYLYEKGLGISIDKNKSFRWYKMAADNGQVAAMAKISNFYFEGFGIELDHKLSIEWKTKAATKGHTYSQSSLAFNYFDGDIIDKDIKKATHWFTEAANLGDNIAQFMLGAIYSNSKEYDKSFEYYKLAADNGHQSAPYYLGLYYLNGTFVSQNNKKATELFKKAYENGNLSAQVEYAYSLVSGRGIIKNLDLAYDLYLDAAEKGNAYAQMYAGNMYRSGVGVQKNIDKAVELYEKSAAQNHQPAIDELSKIKEKNNIKETNIIDLSKYKYITGKYVGILQSSVYGQIISSSIDVYIENNQLKCTYHAEEGDLDGAGFLMEIKDVHSSGITIEFNGIEAPVHVLAILKDNVFEGNYNYTIEGQDDLGTFRFTKVN